MVGRVVAGQKQTMLTVICKLTFLDGQEVIGRMEARSPGEHCPISYSGPTERLGMKLLSGTPSDLELVFQIIARREGATFSLDKSGQYESRTDAIVRDTP
jgi:hypothetical protein